MQTVTHTELIPYIYEMIAEYKSKTGLNPSVLLVPTEVYNRWAEESGSELVSICGLDVYIIDKRPELFAEGETALPDKIYLQ